MHHAATPIISPLAPLPAVNGDSVGCGASAAALDRRGAARLAEILGDESAMTISRSRAEKAFLKLVRDARLPLPAVNQRLGR